MKLSEAIRLGSMLGPQARGSLHNRRRKYIFFGPIVNEYCALGAAFAASGAGTVRRIHDSDGSDANFRGKAIEHKAGDTYEVVEHEWANLMWAQWACPVCRPTTNMMPLYRLIPHLNDEHRWAREQIADLIEPYEKFADEKPVNELSVVYEEVHSCR